jgi:hypothetical protein
MAAPAGSAPAVIRISPMAHFAPAFVALAMLTLMPALGSWALALLAIPVAVSVAIVRLRTTADGDAVTARGLVTSRTMPWGEVEGLRFNRGGWAQACCSGGRDMTLPAVTFATLPRLAAASGGRVPNPYGPSRPQESGDQESGERVGAVQEEPGGDSPGEAENQSQH